MSDEVEYVDAQYEGERYLWLCPWCEAVVEDERDPRGEVVTCDVCNNQARVRR